MNTIAAPLLRPLAPVSSRRAGVIGALIATTAVGLVVLAASAGDADRAVLGFAVTLLAALGVGAAARPYAVSSVS
jgi:hypothetical protein